MRIPKTLKVGGHIYDISHKEHDGLNQNCRGYCDPDRLEIGIEADQHPTKKGQTFLHEALHAITQEYNVPFPDDEAEETVVTALAKGLYQVLRDNKLTFHD